MNIGFWSCIILVIPFVIIGVLFAIFKEKATKFVSGFNSFSKEEQALYDKAHISRDIRNQCFMWTVTMLAGALLSCFLTPYMAIPTYIIWLVIIPGISEPPARTLRATVPENERHIFR